jgi:CcmD family protein
MKSSSIALRRFGAGLVALSILLALLVPAAVWAQTDSQTLAAQNLRAYRHVFVAYAVAWLLVFGWLFSVARRLGRVEKSLQK